MNGIYVCERHDHCVIVYKIATDCPLCVAEENAKDLRADLESVEKAADDRASESVAFEKEVGERDREISQLRQQLSER